MANNENQNPLLDKIIDNLDWLKNNSISLLIISPFATNSPCS